MNLFAAEHGERGPLRTEAPMLSELALHAFTRDVMCNARKQARLLESRTPNRA